MPRGRGGRGGVPRNERGAGLKEWMFKHATETPLMAYTSGERRRAHLAFLFASQGGNCAICRVELDDKMVIDHDHATGFVRGLLCRPCNLGLGAFRDKPDAMRQAARYVSKWRARIYQEAQRAIIEDEEAS